MRVSLDWVTGLFLGTVLLFLGTLLLFLGTLSAVSETWFFVEEEHEVAGCGGDHGSTKDGSHVTVRLHLD